MQDCSITVICLLCIRTYTERGKDDHEGNRKGQLFFVRFN